MDRRDLLDALHRLASGGESCAQHAEARAGLEHAERTLTPQSGGADEKDRRRRSATQDRDDAAR